MRFLLIFSFAVIFHAYFGYPISLAVVAAVRGRRKVEKLPYLPTVTLIITAFNEEKGITNKLENTLKIDYPENRLQVLIASDGSTDRTNEIVLRYGDRKFELLALPEHRGKEFAQAEAVKKASGEILVFTDVSTYPEPTAVKEIVSNFSDPTVGSVSSEDRLLGKDGMRTGEGLYVRYEMWLRRMETAANSLVGLSGSFFAARKEVCQDFSGDMQSDFRTLLNTIRMGLRGVSDPDAVGIYFDSLGERREFDRKVRTVLRGLTVFFHHLDYLNPAKFGLFSYQYLCHKLLRWLAPFFLCIAFIANAWLALETEAYFFLFLLHMGFYALAYIGMSNLTNSALFLVRIPRFFVLVNASILLAWIRYLKGERMVRWTPTERQ